MPSRHCLHLAALLLGSLGATSSVYAAAGYFVLGYGPYAHQSAGAATAVGYDAFVGASNPAKLPYVGTRLDLGVLAFMRQRNVAMPCLNTSVTLVVPAPERWAAMLDECHRYAHLAGRAGTRFIRCFGGEVPAGMHGYHPDAEQSFTTFLTNAHDVAYPQNLLELHTVLRQSMAPGPPLAPGVFVAGLRLALRGKRGVGGHGVLLRERKADGPGGTCRGRAVCPWLAKPSSRVRCWPGCVTTRIPTRWRHSSTPRP